MRTIAPSHTASCYMHQYLVYIYIVISNWVTANPSLEKKSTKLIVASNILAIKHGYAIYRALILTLLLDYSQHLIIINSYIVVSAVLQQLRCDNTISNILISA